MWSQQRNNLTHLSPAVGTHEETVEGTGIPFGIKRERSFRAVIALSTRLVKEIPNAEIHNSKEHCVDGYSVSSDLNNPQKETLMSSTSVHQEPFVRWAINVPQGLRA